MISASDSTGYGIESDTGLRLKYFGKNYVLKNNTEKSIDLFVLVLTHAAIELSSIPVIEKNYEYIEEVEKYILNLELTITPSLT